MRLTTFALALLASAPALAQQARPAPRPEPTILWGSHPELPVAAGVGEAADLRHYRLAKGKFKITMGPALALRGMTSQEVSFPSPVQETWPTIHGTYYRPQAASETRRVPAAVIVHHLGGGFEAEEMLAQFLSANGVATFTISLPNYGKRRIKGTKQGFLQQATRDPVLAFSGFQQAVKDVIRAGDFLRSLPEVDPDRVGVAGVSLGAFVSSVAKGVDPRFRQTVLILGGGNLPALLSNIPNLGRYLGQNEALAGLLRPLVKPVDPCTYAERVNPAEVLMLNATEDEIVPRSSTDALYNALGRPEIKWYECGHYGLALHLLEVMNLTLDHLKKRTPL